MDNTVECPNCDGLGTISGVDDAGDPFLEEECLLCGGEGWIDEEETEDAAED